MCNKNKENRKHETVPLDNLLWFYRQAMYAAVYDAAIVTGKATERFLTSVDGQRILQSYRVNGSCPLRSMENEDRGLGQRILNEIKKARQQLHFILNNNTTYVHLKVAIAPGSYANCYLKLEQITHYFIPVIFRLADSLEFFQYFFLIPKCFQWRLAVVERM